MRRRQTVIEGRSHARGSKSHQYPVDNIEARAGAHQQRVRGRMGGRSDILKQSKGHLLSFWTKKTPRSRQGRNASEREDRQFFLYARRYAESKERAVVFPKSVA